MTIDEAIKLLEDRKKDKTINITKVVLYEGTRCYKAKKENGEIIITIRYEEKKENNFI